jgi:hypothetical protein
MKMLFKISTLLFVPLCLLYTTGSAQENVVSEFLVDLSVVNQMQNQGASGIKIFVGQDENGKFNYLMASTNSEGTINSNNLYLQDETGDCPPTCDMHPSGLTKGSFISSDNASKFIDKYRQSRPEVNNAVFICAYSINRVSEKYNFMKVSFSNKLKITGVKDNGSVNLFSTFQDACNAIQNCPLN